MEITRATVKSISGVAALTLLLVGCGGPTSPPASPTRGEIAVGDAIPAPSSRPVLRISGSISQSNSEKGVKFDLETLEKLPTVEATIYEPFVKEEVSFSGVMVSDLLRVIGADQDAAGVLMKALDDYTVDVSMAELTQSSAMLATRQGGRRIDLEKGGPTRIVFLSEDKLGSNSDMWIWSVERMRIYE